MEYSPTKYEFRISLQKNNLDIFYNLLEYFNIPNDGLLIIFDSENYSPSIYPSWGIDAQALDLTQSDVDSMCPQYIWHLTRKDKFKFLLWFSRKVSLSPQINFAWILSHELTHYKQSTISPELLVINSFLHEILPKINLKEVKSLISIPIELDAELNAWRIIKIFFSSVQIKKFFKDKINDSKYTNHYKCLREYNPDKYYNVIRATSNFLEQNYEMILSIQRNSKDQYISDFDIDSKINILRNSPNKAR